MALYQVEKELKIRMRKAGLNMRDLAYAIGEPPSTTANRLNGWLPLSELHRTCIENRIAQAAEKVFGRKEIGV
jgi:hypothetical protein